MFYYWAMDFYSVNSIFFGRLRKGFLKDYPRLEKLKSNPMKFRQMLLAASIFLTACSTPKYTYHFDHYDYNSGKKTEQSAQGMVVEESPLKLTDEVLEVSSNPQPQVSNSIGSSTAITKTAVKAATEKYNALSRSERKEFRKELKKQITRFAKKPIKKDDGVDSVKKTKVFDTLSALALVFGVAGIVLIMLANVSNAFWIIGAISLGVGAFLFIKWVANGNG